jgi:hypothetical protein
MNPRIQNIQTGQSLNDAQINTLKHCFSLDTGGMIIKKVTEPFLKGPISIAWLSRAAFLPGKAINVALAIQWIFGMSANNPIKLTKKSMVIFNFSSDAANDALRRLESEGLISVQRHPGQRPWIEVVSTSENKLKL